MGSTSVAVGLAGGLGLFLLGLWLATDGVKLAGGSALKANLRTWADGPRRSFETGLAIALLVPSSSASTRASIGLVNSGLVRPADALWLSVGASFGCTVTAWLVVALGTGGGAAQFALALAATGTLLRWSGPQTRRGAWGQAMAGLGVLFLGTTFMAGAFAELGPQGFGTLGTVGRAATVLSFGLGILAAALLRSSSASVALSLIAASVNPELLPMSMVFVAGSLVGSALPAAFVLHRGTPAAKRLAVFHVLFQVLAAFAGLVILSLAWPTVGDPSRSSLSSGLAVAAYLTVAQGLGALVLWPIAPRLQRWLAGRLRTEELDDRRERSLDAHLLAVPDLALEGLVRETREILRLVRDLARQALREDRLTEFSVRLARDDVAALAGQVDESVARLNQETESAEVAAILVELPCATRALREACDAVGRLRGTTGSGLLSGLERSHVNRLRQLRLGVLHLVEGCDPFRPGFRLAECREEYHALVRHLADMSRRLFVCCSRGEIPPEAAERLLASVNLLEHVASRAAEAATRLARARRPWFRETEGGSKPGDGIDPTAIQAAA